MNDVELEYRIADLIRVAYLSGKRGQDMAETIHELRDLAMVEVAKHDAQEKANLQAALEAEFAGKVTGYSTDSEKELVEGFYRDLHKAIAAVFNKGDKI